jgi:hypothetical protein
MTVQKLDQGGLVDLTKEAGRAYVRPSELGVRRLRSFRTFAHDLKLKLEEELSGGERRRITATLGKGGRRSRGTRSAGAVARALKGRTV